MAIFNTHNDKVATWVNLYLVKRSDQKYVSGHCIGITIFASFFGLWRAIWGPGRVLPAGFSPGRCGPVLYDRWPLRRGLRCVSCKLRTWLKTVRNE